MDFQVNSTTATAVKKRVQLALAATLIMASTTGCDKAKGLLDNSAVPGEIADACVILQSSGSEIHFDRGYRLSDVVRTIVDMSAAQDSSWEKSTKGYIWSWKRRDDLQQVEYHNRFEFAVLPPRDDPRYQGPDCGPTLVRTEGGTTDGQRVQDMSVAIVFKKAFDILEKQRQQTPTDVLGSPPPTEVRRIEDASVQQSGPQGPITATWLLGTWGPAQYNPDNNPNASCDTDSVVTFNADGSYKDGGGSGRYRVDGGNVTYFNRVMRDIATGRTDHSEYNQPVTTKVERVDNNTLREEGTLLRRCQSS